MKTGPERELVERYFDRFSKAGPPLGLEFAGVSEIPESRGQTAELRKAEEAQRIHDALDNASSGGAALILLDERGKALGSEALRQRSDGCATTASASLSSPLAGRTVTIRHCDHAPISFWRWAN